MTKKILTMTLAALIGAAVPAAAGVTEHSVPLGPGDTLDIDLDTGGSIHLGPSGSGTLTVLAETTGRDADAIEVEVTETGRGARIRSDAGHGNVRASLRLDIGIPPGAVVTVSTMGGEVTVRDVELELRGKTMGGDLDLANVDGEVSFTTMGGDVTLRDTVLRGSIKTMGGDLRLGNNAGDLELTTMGGDIEIDSAAEDVEVKTMGGDIRVSSARGRLDVETMGGNLDLRGLEGDVEGTTMGGDVDAALEASGSGRSVSLVSMGGDVVLRVPRGMGMDVEIELEYTRRGSRNYRIESDFDLTVEEDAEWYRDGGDARKTIRGTGTIDGGGNRIHLRTVNGNVRLLAG